MIECLFVGIGGAIGAILRYLLSTISIQKEFPIITLLTNLIGAVVIGCIVGVHTKTNFSPKILVLLKTGLCGGFTTFSTFSLETLLLFENGKYITGISYVAASIFLCILGVWIGKMLIKINILF